MYLLHIYMLKHRYSQYHVIYTHFFKKFLFSLLERLEYSIDLYALYIICFIIIYNII